MYVLIPRRLLAVFGWIGLSCLLVASAAAADTPGTALSITAMRNLQSRMTQLVSRLEWKGVQVGVLVEDFSGRRLFAHREKQPFVLASNTKLFTTAAALLALPEDFRWRTSARLVGDRLWIIGGGDATFHIIDGFSYPDKFLDEVAKALKARRRTQLSELVIDARYFDTVFRHPNWPRDQLRRRYAAPVSGLPYARGLVRMRVGRTSVYAATLSPLSTAETFLRHGLRRRGIRVGTVRLAKAKEKRPPASKTIYVQRSPWTLDRVIRETNTESDNYLAEHLLKTLGAEVLNDGSFAGGIRVVRQALEELNVPLEGFEQLDGSGLARKSRGGNLATPETVTALLRAVAQTERGETFVHSLAIGGVTGTLAHRFREPPLRGRVFAKTGSINGTMALSGYLVGEGTRLVAFSILANYTMRETYKLRKAIRAFQRDALLAIWEYMEQVEEEWTAPPTLVKAFSATLSMP